MASPTSETLNKFDTAAHDSKNKPLVMENSLEKISHDAGKRIGAMASDIATKTTDYVESSRDYVKENPVKGMAIAAAAGVVTGSLLTLALRRRH